MGVAHTGDQRLHLRFVGDVAGDTERAPAAAGDPGGALPRVLRVDVDADDSGALVGEAARDAGADVRARAGDNRDLAFELDGGRSAIQVDQERGDRARSRSCR
jgi:hypothetical protein